MAPAPGDPLTDPGDPPTHRAGDPLPDGVRARRLAAQLLAGPPAAGPEQVARHLLAVQAQDLRGARLAVRGRTSGLTTAELDTALADRRLVISWLCRGTLHLVAAEDLFWLHDLTTPPLLTGCLRRLAQEGVSPGQSARATGLIARWLAEDGPLTRDELAPRLRARRIPVENQALVHILLRATLEGLIVRGPMKGRRQAFVLVHDWLGPRPPIRDRDQALAELVSRYLIGHSPAAPVDIARWSGLPLRDIRTGLQRLGGRLDQRAGGLVEPRKAPSDPYPAPPRLLGSWDPLLVGWKDRRFVTGAHDRDVVTGGLFRPLILLGGQVAGLWRITEGEVVLRPFEPPSESDRLALERDAADVRRYLRLEPALGGSDRA
jgi:hypothetical protein